MMKAIDFLMQDLAWNGRPCAVRRWQRQLEPARECPAGAETDGAALAGVSCREGDRLPQLAGGVAFRAEVASAVAVGGPIKRPARLGRRAWLERQNRAHLRLAVVVRGVTYESEQMLARHQLPDACAPGRAPLCGRRAELPGDIAVAGSVLGERANGEQTPPTARPFS